MRENDIASTTALEALELFVVLGDSYGEALAFKLLRGLGHSEEDVASARRKQKAMDV